VALLDVQDLSAELLVDGALRAWAHLSGWDLSDPTHPLWRFPLCGLSHFEQVL